MIWDALYIIKSRFFFQETRLISWIFFYVLKSIFAIVKNISISIDQNTNPEKKLVVSKMHLIYFLFFIFLFT